jgi:hypothetical protein
MIDLLNIVMTNNTPEYKHMCQALNDYTYEDFQNDMKTWL